MRVFDVSSSASSRMQQKNYKCESGQLDYIFRRCESIFEHRKRFNPPPCDEIIENPSRFDKRGAVHLLGRVGETEISFHFAWQAFGSFKAGELKNETKKRFGPELLLNPHTWDSKSRDKEEVRLWVSSQVLYLHSLTRLAVINLKHASPPRPYQARHRRTKSDAGPNQEFPTSRWHVIHMMRALGGLVVITSEPKELLTSVFELFQLINFTPDSAEKCFFLSLSGSARRWARVSLSASPFDNFFPQPRAIAVSIYMPRSALTSKPAPENWFEQLCVNTLMRQIN